MDTSRIRSIRGGDVAVGMVAVVCITFLIWIVVHKHGGSHDQPTTAPPATTASASASASTSASPSSDASELTDTKSQLTDRASKFSEIYFSPNTHDSVTAFKNKVQPYATSHFMQSASFGFTGGSLADEAMLKKGGYLQATVRREFDGELSGPNKAYANGVIQLQVTVFDADGNSMNSYIYDQPMVWVFQNGTWLIYDTPAT